MSPVPRATALAAIVALILIASLAVPSPASAAAQVAPKVVISEVHYHPQAVGTDYPDFDDRDDTEFLEILNLESTAIDISGWCVDSAVDFCFANNASLPAATTIVLAKDAVAFDDVYGFMPAGLYSGKLSNSGELLRLLTSDGTVASEVSWTTSHPWPVTPDGNGPSLNLVSDAGGQSSPANWAASSTTGGNPGVAPSLVNASPPLVLSHNADELVNANTQIPVVATTVNATAMTLVYNVDYGANQTIAMTSVGNEWQATLPTIGTGGLVQYRFEAAGPGGVTTSPRADDVLDWWAVAVASNQPHDVPVMDLYFDPDAWDDINDKVCGCAGAVAYEGRIWTDVVVRRAGSTSLNSAKANLRLEFPDGQPFEASFLDSPADELTLDGGTTNVDMLREHLSWELMTAIGFPPIQSSHVRSMNNGSFQGLYLLREEQDADWRGRHDLDRGLMYKVEGTTDTFGFSGEHEKKEGFDESDADMFTLRACLDEIGAPFRACALDLLDVPQLVNEIAATAVIRNIDQREFNYFIYRDNTENMLWRILPDDLDRTWGIDGGGAQLGNPVVSSAKSYRRCIGTDTTPANEICRALMRWPEFETMYNRRLRTLVDEVLADPTWHSQVGSLANLIEDDWNDDEAKWNRTSFNFPTITTALDGWIYDYVAHQRSGGHDGLVPAAQSVSPQVAITDYRSDPGDGLGYLLLTNPSTSEAVDVSNWTIDGASELPLGLVILPGTTVAVSTNDQMFRAAQPTFTGIRGEMQGTISGQVTLADRSGQLITSTGSTGPAPLVLNEWNAVGGSKLIASGDTFYGQVVGNGGDWFELVVTQDHVDLRGMVLELRDSESGPPAVTDALIFGTDPLLADVRAGTIITVSETLADDITFAPSAGDWWLNFQANTAGDGAYFTPASQSDFDTNNEDWQLRIIDGSGQTVFGPAGEGIAGVSGVGSTEVGELEADPSEDIVAASGYDDGDTSTFGSPNEFDGGEQDFSPLRSWLTAPGDVNCNNILNVLDAVAIAQFTVSLRGSVDSCLSPRPNSEIVLDAADTNGDGIINVLDAVTVSQCVAGLTNALCP